MLGSKVSESVDTPYSWDWNVKRGPTWVVQFFTDKYRYLVSVDYDPRRDEHSADFQAVGRGYADTGEHKAGRVLATVVNILKRYLVLHQPARLVLHGSEEKRGRLYYALAKRLKGAAYVIIKKMGVGSSHSISAVLVRKGEARYKGRQLTRESTTGIAEVVDKPFSWAWQTRSKTMWVGVFKSPVGETYEIVFKRGYSEQSIWEVSFGTYLHFFDLTREGRAGRVLATVVAAVKEFLSKVKPVDLWFAGSRGKTGLYTRLVNRALAGTGYKPYPHGDVIHMRRAEGGRDV